MITRIEYKARTASAVMILELIVRARETCKARDYKKVAKSREFVLSDEQEMMQR